MRKGKSVIGQDVFSLADGSRIESVSDLIINEANDAIIALLIDEGGLMGASKVIPLSAVHHFGPSAVMVEDSAVVIEADDVPEINEILERDATLLDRRVLTSKGEDLGKVNDMYFEEQTGTIRGFEVSNGPLGDLMRGAAYLPIEKLDVMGPDAVIATLHADQVKQHLESQSGGLEAVADSARERAEETRDKVGELGEKAGDKAGEVSDQVGSMTEEAQDRDGTLVGRYTRRDVSDRAGSVIVANGQRIELEQVKRARQAGAIDDLYGAVGAKREKTASEQASEAAESASDTAHDLWGKFTTKITEFTDGAGKRMDAEQANRRLNEFSDAIGRPVTKVILDRDDEVILDVGDIITHKAVQRAHESGMLDSLLNSVYKADVTFERDELKARIPADSTIEDSSGGASVVEELEERRDQDISPDVREKADDNDGKDSRGRDAGDDQGTGIPPAAASKGAGAQRQRPQGTGSSTAAPAAAKPGAKKARSSSSG